MKPPIFDPAALNNIAQFWDRLHDEFVLAQNRFRAADANEDAFSAFAECGYCAGVKKAMDLFRSIVLEETGQLTKLGKVIESRSQEVPG